MRPCPISPKNRGAGERTSACAARAAGSANFASITLAHASMGCTAAASACSAARDSRRANAGWVLEKRFAFHNTRQGRRRRSILGVSGPPCGRKTAFGFVHPAEPRCVRSAVFRLLHLTGPLAAGDYYLFPASQEGQTGSASTRSRTASFHIRSPNVTGGYSSALNHLIASSRSPRARAAKPRTL
jgi:hypothetical protein